MVKGGERLFGTFFQSFGFAFRGLAEAWHRERNFRVQCVYAVCVTGLLLWLRPDQASSLVVLLALALLLAAELMNSAVERAVDLCVTDYHPLARTAKDLAASSVLLIAVATALINLWVLGGMVAADSQPTMAVFLVSLGVFRFLRGGQR